jgi:hypothetical protein
VNEPLARLDRLFASAGVPYVIIGAHAVNAWVEPRFTADIDVTIEMNTAALQRLREVLAAEGFHLLQEQGADLASGPDFLRFRSLDGSITLEFQAAKTEFQREAIRRAVTAGDTRVATVEDLIIMKLIADRPKDRVDLLELAALPNVDWDYVDHWAHEWQIADRLERLRQSLR